MQTNDPTATMASMSMISGTTATLDVPGATLHYQVRGSGPVLLMICGGIYDADLLADLAQRLADQFTVVTYDRRGNSRSPLAGPPVPQRIEVHADDAHLLLSAVAGTDPAYVFGNSSGGQIALDLAASHPEQVRAVVAHEPPLFALLPDADRWPGLIEGVLDVYRADGAGPALAIFGAAMGMSDDPRGDRDPEDGGDSADRGAGAGPGDGAGAPPPEVVEMMARLQANTEFFLGYEAPGFSGHTADLAALRAASSTIIPAVGRDSAGEPPHQAALALAEQLGVDAIVLPGGHGGFGSHADGYAAELRKLFASR